MHFKRRNICGRKLLIHEFSLLTNHISKIFYYCFLRAFRARISLSLLPVIASGCSSAVSPSADMLPVVISSMSSQHINSGTGTEGGTLDILVFEDDRLRRLDTYQRIEQWSGEKVYAASTGGDKLVFLCCNPQGDRYDWAKIGSYASLDKKYCNLEDEIRGRLVMTGEGRSKAGEDTLQAEVTALASEVHLKSLRCDFSGTPYSGKKITEAKAYLTYVNASCNVFGNSSGGMIRLINPGLLNMSDVKLFKDSSMIVQELAGEIDGKAKGCSESFLCYPYKGGTSISTRLVIEGKIDGKTYYWPMEVCPDGGISRNCRYSFSVNIKRKGSTDPDCLVALADADINLEIKRWAEKEEYKVGF